MQPRIQTSAGMETADETVARISAALGGGTKTDTPSIPTGPTTKANPLLEALSARLLQQTQGISSSSSSALQDSINEAIASSQTAGDLKSAALQSEREREVAFARDRAGATYTTALEGRTGYATQVAGLRELTETTEKSIRDIDKRYQESILANDSATAQRLADLRVKKLEFQMTQEQNFYQNLLAVGNLQQQALQMQQQNEQFWITKKQDEDQFTQQLTQSKYQFEQNYGISLQELGLKEQQLEIERQKFNLSLQEYNDRKKALQTEKNFTNTKALIAQDMKNKLSAGVTDADGNVIKVTRDTLLTPAYMAQIAEATGFDGTTEELSQVISEAYGDISSDKKFMAQYLGAPTPMPFTNDRNQNNTIQQMNNQQKAQYDSDRGVVIQSPESFWASLFN